MLKILPLIALLFSCQRPLTSDFLPRSRAEKQRQATVAIHMSCLDLRGGKVKRWKGSGVIVGEHTVLTANHVAECPSMIYDLTIETLSGLLVEAHPTVQSEEHDIAKLETEQSLPRFDFQIGPVPEVGELICSESAIPSRARKCGKVFFVHSKPSDDDIKHRIDVEGGNSGSGVFDKRGRLIGIITERRLDRRGGAAASLWSHREAMRPI